MEIKTDYQDNIVCPYCGKEHEWDNDIEPREDSQQFDCYECEKTFLIYASITINWSSKKADCLNGASHKWSEWRQIYNDIYDRQCKVCNSNERIKKEAPDEQG